MHTFKEPREFAADLLQGNSGDTHEMTVASAKRSLMNAVKAFPQTPASFWVAAFEMIDVLAAQEFERAYWEYLTDRSN